MTLSFPFQQKWKRFYALVPAHVVTWNSVDSKEAMYVIPVGH
jgi:hypothetical protein